VVRVSFPPKISENEKVPLTPICMGELIPPWFQEKRAPRPD
jgi:hypothetical protein